MKEIKAIIQPFMLIKVVSALHKIEGLPGITISETKGFGKGKVKKTMAAMTKGFLNLCQRIKLKLLFRMS